jgi:NAD(P)-dependent dehydrogenase (short-subunit alcohol dehydrogenase family)
MKQLPNERTAVVTGAGSLRGIGKAVAKRLGASGWSVAVLDIDEAGAKAVAEEITASVGAKALAVGVDITDPSAVDRAFQQIEAGLPPVIGLANVAGVSSPVPFLDVTLEEWDRVMNVNVRGTFLVTQRALPSMLAHGVGRIVSVSSVSAQRGGGTFSKVPYSAAKAGILGMTRALAREVGKTGVTVNAVSPGPIDTDIMGGTLSETRKAELIADLVVDRVGTVEDVAAVINFLMGPDAGYVTGSTYNVNGGLIID